MKQSYWKRGSKEDAERIKQAFLDAGCQVMFFKCDNERMLYVFDGELEKMAGIPYECVIASAIMDSHMFCELELPEKVIPKPKHEVGELVVLDDLLGRITDSKYEYGMWLYRVGCRNTWNFDYELMKADFRDEHRILKGGGA